MALKKQIINSNLQRQQLREQGLMKSTAITIATTTITINFMVLMTIIIIVTFAFTVAAIIKINLKVENASAVH